MSVHAFNLWVVVELGIIALAYPVGLVRGRGA